MMRSDNLKFPVSGLTMPNRYWLAAMTNQQSHEDGTLSDDEFTWLKRRAEGGFGVVTTCAVHVTRHGQGWPGELGAWHDRHIPGLSRLAKAIKECGTLGLVQLFHGGARSPAKLTGVQPISAMDGSPPGEGGNGEEPRSAREDELLAIIEDFAAAAKRVQDAGWSGVELHGAHGYLLAQFLSPRYNLRKDGWGDDAEGRWRLLLSVLKAVKSATGPGFAVGVRISPRNYEGDGVRETLDALKLVERLIAEGVDFIHLSLWDSFRHDEDDPEKVPVLQKFSHVVSGKCPLVVAGGLRTAADRDRAFAMGADAIAIGRAAIAYADWPMLIEKDGGQWQPAPPPYPVAHLRGQGLGDAFIRYMQKWPGYVSDPLT
ncbi:MAG: NADH:flavin oxidoreductase [Verrucomicrobia bacterium]|nr:NADH:flavin oxidoreductase [Verrucomicrobiota bacterium]